MLLLYDKCFGDFMLASLLLNKHTTKVCTGLVVCLLLVTKLLGLTI